jgi:hypothetical protein
MKIGAAPSPAPASTPLFLSSTPPSRASMSCVSCSSDEDAGGGGGGEEEGRGGGGGGGGGDMSLLLRLLLKDRGGRVGVLTANLPVA